jgi:alkylation response protein AidB-like acyl-CoA dehydrogenase
MISKTSFASKVPAEEIGGGHRHDAEIAAIEAALKHALAQSDLSIFYRAFRTGSLPFLCGEYQDHAELLFPACFEIVHRLGGISPAVGLAVENHYYVTSAIATFPAAADPVLEQHRQRLLSSIVSERLLVANTNSKIHSDKLGELGTAARRHGEGYRVSGVASYASLASEADLLILMTELEGEGTAIFAIPSPRQRPAITIGPYLFPSAMVDSDTRRITFHDEILPPEALVALARDKIAGLLPPFEMAWHQSLIPALYLGAAARAIEEVRAFLNATKGRDGEPLSTLDGMVIDTGRLMLEYLNARSVVDAAGRALCGVKELPRDAEFVTQAVQMASAAKYAGTRSAEAIVTAARRIVGARAFIGDCIIERLSQEVMFGVLGPEVSAVIERRFGKQVLDSERFPHPLLS